MYSTGMYTILMAFNETPDKILLKNNLLKHIELVYLNKGSVTFKISEPESEEGIRNLESHGLGVLL